MNSRIVIIALVAGSLAGCGGAGKEPKEHPSDIDTVAIDTSNVIREKKPFVVINKHYDNVARYIAGMQQRNDTVVNPVIAKDMAWKQYADGFDSQWKKYDSTRLSLIRTWSDQELQDVYKATPTVFYPFSGPDILNAYTLFPHAKQFIMVGLEPVGSLPDISKQMAADTADQYFKSIRQSLTAILNLSFFRTKAMKTELRGEEVNGTIHLLLLFLERTGNSIVDIRPVNINYEGMIVTYPDFRAAQRDSLKSKGVEIDFTDKDSIVKKVFYFSTDLSDGGLKNNTGFKKFVTSQEPYNTYLKSASYLMYESQFSVVRNLILNGSRHVLQDDSGIPFKHFDTSKWDFTFYGKYTGSIPLFKYGYQQDLFVAYKDSMKIKPLPFGIGYKHRKGDSNLMLSRKKEPIGEK